MYIKLINPVKDGLKIYDNSRSCAQVTNYLVQEKEGRGEAAIFFNIEKDTLTKEEATRIIDENVKGLKSGDDKFINIAINPSDEELTFIGNDKEKLKEYAKEVMRQYAENFEIKNKVSQEDIVWVATIHDERHYKHNDIYYTEAEQKKNGKYKGDTKPGMENFKVGDKKEGLNTHIHVIVSCRDRDMKTTLNPLIAKQNRFSIYNFSARTNKSFAEKFNHSKTLKNYRTFISKQYQAKALKKFEQLSKRINFFMDKKEFNEYLKTCKSKKSVYDALCQLSRERSTNEKFPTSFVFTLLQEKVKELEKKDILLDNNFNSKKDIKEKSVDILLYLPQEFSMLTSTQDTNQDADYIPVKKR